MPQRDTKDCLNLSGFGGLTQIIMFVVLYFMIHYSYLQIYDLRAHKSKQQIGLSFIDNGVSHDMT